MERAKRLRQLLESPGMLCVVSCFDALSARLAHQAGFPVGFMSGASVTATSLGMPDLGLISVTEMTDQLRRICDAVEDQPVIADGDTGFGNELNVRRTVRQYAAAGAACIMIEDQVFPKRCGHFDRKQVLPRDEARMKIRAAVEAAREVGILVLARTDARSVEGFEAALERCRDFEEEGADIVFLEAPLSAEEIAEFTSCMRQPTMANMIAGGKTPYLRPQELEILGPKLGVYHSTLFASIQAMQDSLEWLRSDGATQAPAATSFDEYKRVTGMSTQEAWLDRYSLARDKKDPTVSNKEMSHAVR